MSNGDGVETKHIPVSLVSNHQFIAWLLCVDCTPQQHAAIFEEFLNGIPEETVRFYAKITRFDFVQNFFAFIGARANRTELEKLRRQNRKGRPKKLFDNLCKKIHRGSSHKLGPAEIMLAIYGMMPETQRGNILFELRLYLAGETKLIHYNRIDYARLGSILANYMERTQGMSTEQFTAYKKRIKFKADLKQAKFEMLNLIRKWDMSDNSGFDDISKEELNAQLKRDADDQAQNQSDAADDPIDWG